MAESDTVPIKTHLQSYPNSTSLLDPPSAGKAGGLSDARNAAEIPQACEQIVEVVFDLRYKWSGTTYEISIAESDTVGDLKALIFSQTTIPVERQKILGLVKGKLPEDEVVLSQLQLSGLSGKIFAVLGTPIGKEAKAVSAVGPSESLDEQDVDPGKALKLDDPALRKRNARKLQEAVSKLQINIMNEPRPGKKLLVLDLDYTILDSTSVRAVTHTLLKLPFVAHAWKSNSFHAFDYMRPGMHEFLASVYPHYDIVIWSQTSWMWLESKLLELGMVGEEQTSYRISFGTAMRSMDAKLFQLISP
ncbi:MAG: hypothetical protein CYPHOPRED_000154 [Cyphobasidiales sp. Tagirdzhanova-0007]|nr:MAG: hypothetical protein CYPHOPRED_000154 [Cyphobasidiales sp. Tagirdzhanova-0007]